MFGKRYDTWGPVNMASRDTFHAEERHVCRVWNPAESLLAGKVKEEQESGDGVSSPPLWRMSPARGRQHHQNRCRDLSPSYSNTPESRTQAIARGQRELMEMVRNMPESCYELSLKDLVEHPMVLARQEETAAEERDSLTSELLYRRRLGKKKNQSNVLIGRDRRIVIGGYYLEMMFPLCLGSTRKKTKKKDVDGTAKGVDKEWWKRRASVSCDCESGGSSLNSSRSKRRHGTGGCWSCITPPRTAENQD